MRVQVLLLCVLVTLVCAVCALPKHQPDENEILSKFREKIKGNLTKPHMKTDLYLSKWLKASDYDIDDAEEMFYGNLKWRQEMDMDNFKIEDFSDLQPDYPAYTDTHDKQGRPVGLANLGKWDYRTAVVQGKLPRLTKYTCGIYEIMDRKLWDARDKGLNISSVIFIGDMDGFSSITHLCSSCISIFINLVDCLESHYPYLAKEFIFINAPMKFKVMANAASVVLRRDTVKSLVYLPEKAKWLPYLDERIERDQRYHNAGGTRGIESSD